MSPQSASPSWQPGCSHPEGVYPATIRQLLRAKQQHSESNFFLDGIKLGRVTCVAGIVDIREHPSMKTYVLEDGTGRLSVVLESEIDALLEGVFKEHVYVRVIGRLNAFNGVNRLKATHMRLVHDMHEPFFHCLEAMVVFIANQKQSQLVPRAQLSSTAPEVTQSPPSMLRAAIHTQGRNEDHLTAQESGTNVNETLAGIDGLTLVDDYSDGEDLNEPGSVQLPLPPRSPSRSPSSLPNDTSLEWNDRPSLLPDPYSSLSPLKRDVIIQILDNAPYFPNGVPIQVMYRRIRLGPSTVRESEIRQAIEDMMDDGLLYSTIDGDHFKMVD